MSILIAPATSRTNTYVINALLARNPQVSLRLLVNSAQSETELNKKYPSATTVVANLNDPATLAPAVSGVKAVFLNVPLSEHAVQMGKDLIDAAKRAGVEYLMFSSVLHSFIQRMLHHRQKLDVEEYLFESGLNYTILEPTHLMQNVNIPNAVSSGTLNLPYASNVLHGFLDIPDLAEIAAKILLSPTPSDHYFARYELTGSNCTYDEMARVLSEYAGKEIKVVKVDPEALAKSRGYNDPWAQERVLAMLKYYEERGLPGNTNTTRWLLGREPAKWQDVIAREMKAAKGT